MNSGRTTRLAACLIATALMLLGASAAQAAGAARVRFLQASAGAGSAELLVSSAGIVTSAGGPAAFGELTPYADVPAGPATLRVGATQRTQTLVPGAAYTVLAHGHGQLRVLRDARARAGRAQLRVIHAAPELGTPDLRLDGRVVAQTVHYAEDTGYIDLTPGAYTLAVTAHGSTRAVVERRIALAAGTASTAAVTGTAGTPVGIVTATDDTLTPGGPPETGLGGLASGGGTRWPLVGLAAVLGAAAALGLRRLTTRRPGA